MGETRKLAAILVADVVGYSLPGARTRIAPWRACGASLAISSIPLIAALTWPIWTRSGSMTAPSKTRNLWPRRPRLVGRPRGRTSRAYSALPRTRGGLRYVDESTDPRYVEYWDRLIKGMRKAGVPEQ